MIHYILIDLVQHMAFEEQIYKYTSVLVGHITCLQIFVRRILNKMFLLSLLFEYNSIICWIIVYPAEDFLVRNNFKLEYRPN